MKRLPQCLLAALIAALSLPAMAQPGRGPGMRYDQDNTPGWTLMSAEERAAHRARMRAFGSYDECKRYMDEHQKLMAARAREQGKALRGPRNDACELMKARGIVK